MKTLVVLLLLCLTSACGRHSQRGTARSGGEEPETASSSVTATVQAHDNASSNPVPATLPAPAPGQTVTIDSPGEGDSVVRFPIVVRGRAKTFENHVLLRLRDSRGTIVLETTAIARGDMGSFNPYDAQLSPTRDPGGSLTLEALDLSPKDGRVVTRAFVTLTNNAPLRTVTLHFIGSNAAATDCSRVSPVPRKIPATLSVARTAVDALIEGPTDKEKAGGFSSPFPPGFPHPEVTMRGDVADVDFPASAGSVGGSCRAQAIRACITRTLQELPGIRTIRITAGGSEGAALQP